MKVGSYEKLDDALYIWFRQQREKCLSYWSCTDGKGESIVHVVTHIQNQRKYLLEALDLSGGFANGMG